MSLIDEKKLSEIYTPEAIGYVGLSPLTQLDVLETLQKALAVVRAARELKYDGGESATRLRLALKPFDAKAESEDGK